MSELRKISTKKVSQREKIPGREDQVLNSAGGYVFEVDDFIRLERFLVLGTEGSTYYASGHKLTKENAECIIRCIKKDGIRTVDVIVGMSDSGRAPKNDQALFALAVCASHGDLQTKQYALEKLPIVARIGTHIFQFAQFAMQFRGWGRGLKRAIQNWYNSKNIDRLAYQVVKYQQRNGMSHRDMLRLCHVKTDDTERNNIYKWVIKKDNALTSADSLPKVIRGYELCKLSKKPESSLINIYGLTREMIPTDWFNDVNVWEAMLPNMPLTAMIRNLGKMSSVGLLEPFNPNVNYIIDRLGNSENIKKARVHPLAILTAMKIYEQGKGLKGSLTWTPVSQVVDVLNKAFYKSFEYVEPTNKRWLLALDVSGSMDWGLIAGMPFSPREAASAMALVTAATEPNYHIMAFSDRLVPVSISPNQRLTDVTRTLKKIRMGGTDCRLPMKWARKNNIEVDVFVIYTDNETWAGKNHVCLELKHYRNHSGINAKCIVVGLTATPFTVADPNDGGMMDIVGFDTSAPKIMSDFVKN